MHFNRQGTQRLHAGDTASTCRGHSGYRQVSAVHRYTAEVSGTQLYNQIQFYRQAQQETALQAGVSRYIYRQVSLRESSTGRSHQIQFQTAGVIRYSYRQVSLRDNYTGRCQRIQLQTGAI